MSGFDAVAVDGELFAGRNVRTNFLVTLGYGDMSGAYARLPRLAFDEVATIE